MKKYRNAGGMAVPRPVMIEAEDEHERVSCPPPCESLVEAMRPNADRIPYADEDNEVFSQSRSSSACSSPSAVDLKPQTIILHRPIPMRATEEFYKEAASLPFAEVQRALEESHAWHLKYTGNQAALPAAGQQLLFPSCEKPDERTATSTTQALTNAEETINAMMMDREGAKNPSPSGGASSNPSTPTNTNNNHHNHKRLRGSVSPDALTRDGPQEDESGEEATAMVQRPVALRITAHRPGVPHHILETTQRSDSLSPLSVDDSQQHAGKLSQTLLSSAQQHESSTTPAMIELCDENDRLPREQQPSATTTASQVQAARDGLLHSLAVSGGDTESPAFAKFLQILQDHYHSETTDHVPPQQQEGMWLTLTKPTFFDCLGDNDQGDPMYTLARMSFNMFCPADLICSLQGNFNSVERVLDERSSIAVPKSLREAVGESATILRTYNIITAFTIEPPMASYPNAPNKDVTKPIRGLMTTYGYMIPDPEIPTRDSVWITGGKIEPHPSDKAAWNELFAAHPPARHGFSQRAQLLAVKWLMGANLPQGMDAETGVMEYTFSRPLGGHGFAYIDTLYHDDSLRVVRGHRGTYFVFSRVPQEQEP